MAGNNRSMRPSNGPGRHQIRGQKLNLKSMGRLLKYLAKDYPVHLSLIIICATTNAVIGVLPSVYIKTITDYIVEGLNGAGWEGIRSKVISAVLVMIGLYLVALIAAAVQGQLNARMTQGFLHKMRTRMFDKMQRLPIRYFDSHSDGDIMSHYTNDIDTLRQVVSQSLPQFFTAGLTVSALLIIMLYYSMVLMLVVFLGVIAMFTVTKKVGGNSARYFMKQQQSLGKVEGFIEEMTHGEKVIKVFTREDKTLEEFDALNDELCRDATAANKYGNILMPILGNIGNILYVMVAFMGGLIVSSGGTVPNLSFESLISTGSILGVLTLPVIASYLGMVKQFTNNVNQVSQQINSVAMALAGAERIFDLIDEKPEEDEGRVSLVFARENADGSLTESPEFTGIWAWKKPKEVTLSDFAPAPTECGDYELCRLRGDVRLVDVDFSYVPEKAVLSDVSLYAHPGQKIAFVGATGAGKTTITNLINRFYDIEEGKILYDGINIKDIKKDDLRKSLGMVLQEVNLFTGSVMENIRYGNLFASDEECINAAKLANAHDFIVRLPEGYDTVLSNAGANLSQGQRQLLSIARAAVGNPPVMILDEATSSIDTRTESLVQEGMDRLMAGRTVFVIAHRLSTVRNSNAIMVLDHGKITERGDHDDLIAQKGTYYRLYTGAFELE